MLLLVCGFVGLGLALGWGCFGWLVWIGEFAWLVGWPAGWLSCFQGGHSCLLVSPPIQLDLVQDRFQQLENLIIKAMKKDQQQTRRPAESFKICFRPKSDLTLGFYLGTPKKRR